MAIHEFPGGTLAGPAAGSDLTGLMESSPGAFKHPFIRVTEVWVPSRSGDCLELSSGIYGPLADFERISRETQFHFNEGLPGKAWAAGHPIVLKNLTTSYFKRGEAAHAVGLTCAVALPIFAGTDLVAVVVLFCGDDREHIGAIEIWHAAPGAIEMGLVDGYYGTADVFEWYSRHITFMSGIGLPGQTWATGMPVIMADLGRSRRFLRWESAERVGLNRGVGIPCGRDPGEAWVLTLLSALGTPIARRFEAWVPDPRGNGLVFQSGFCEFGVDLAAAYGSTGIPLNGIGALSDVVGDGVPVIATDLSREPEIIQATILDTCLETMVAIPLFDNKKLKAVVAWYL